MLCFSFFVTARDIFPRTSTFYVGKTYKCEKPWNFVSKQIVLTCTFYRGKTYKCAVAVFAILMKNLNIKKLKRRTLKGFILIQMLLILVPFWRPVGYMLVVLGFCVPKGVPFRGMLQRRKGTKNPTNITPNVPYENCSHFWDIF